uniref:BTB domain-containing protein n=1 Tax=Panagrolaimus sp. JU765 TaxID=591449 RepID=A0AC34Q9T7_9BILA
AITDIAISKFDRYSSLDTTTDIVFCVNGENIPAHKVFFYYRSPVFATMFDGPMAPKSENGEKPVIKIDDERISIENFKLFLGFLYTDKVDITGDNVFLLLNMAKLYDVESLVKLCEEFLLKNLTSENVVAIANSASVFPDSMIFKEAVEFLTKKTDLFTSSQKLLELNGDALLQVLKCEEGNFICHPDDLDESGKCFTCRKQASFPESQLFGMVLKWGKNQCMLQQLEKTLQNLKKNLEPFLPWIRFPTMTVEYLTTVVYPWKLLDSETMLHVIIDAQHFSKGEKSNESSFRKDERRAYMGVNVKPRDSFQRRRRLRSIIQD